MKIISEKIGKEFDTVEECLEAEKAYEETQEKLKAEKEAKLALKKSRANEIEEAYKEYVEAGRKYEELKSAFIKDYGYLHMTYRDASASPYNFVSQLIRDFF